MKDLSRGPGSLPRTPEQRELARKIHEVKTRADYIALSMELGDTPEEAARDADDFMRRYPGLLASNPALPIPSSEGD